MDRSVGFHFGTYGYRAFIPEIRPKPVETGNVEREEISLPPPFPTPPMATDRIVRYISEGFASWNGPLIEFSNTKTGRRYVVAS